MKEEMKGCERMRRREKKDGRCVRLEKTPTPKSLSSLDEKLLEMEKDERQSQSSTQNQSINQQTDKSKQTHCLMSSYK